MKYLEYIILAFYSKIHKLLWLIATIYVMFFLKIGDFRYSIWALTAARDVSNIFGDAILGYSGGSILLAILSFVLGILSVIISFAGTFLVLIVFPYIMLKSLTMGLQRFAVIRSTDLCNEMIWKSEDKEGKERSFRLTGESVWEQYSAGSTIDDENIDKENESNYTEEDYSNTYEYFNEEPKSDLSQISDLDKAKIFFGIDENPCTLEELKKIRNKLVKQWHSDTGDGDDQRTAKINNYYDLLKKNI